MSPYRSQAAEVAVGDLVILQSSVPCVKCRYDLRGLTVTGKCPECGTDIVRSNPECPRCAATYGRRFALRASGKSPGAWNCVQCGGVGFEARHLQRTLQERRGGVLPKRPRATEFVSQTAVSCGHCRTPAASIIVDRQVMMERCSGCGFVWLDADELAAIADYVTRTIGEKPVTPDVERVLHDAEELKRAATDRGNIAVMAAGGVIEVILSCLFG